jgi:ABC-type multidrug transport system fused ATPase/permease subunit
MKKSNDRIRGAYGILRSLKQTLKPYRGRLSAALVFMLLVDLMAYMIPFLISHITDEVFVRIQEDGVLGDLVRYSLLLLGMALVRGVIIYGMIRLFWSLSELVARDLRFKLFEKLQNLEARFYDKSQTGDLMSRIMNDVQVIRNFIAYGIEHRVRIGLISGTLFVLMVLLNWRLALLVYSFIPLIMVALLYFSKILESAVMDKHSRLGRVSGFLQENLKSMRIIKAFGAERDQYSRFLEENHGLYQADSRVYGIQARMNPLMLLTGTIGTLVITIYGGYQIIQGTGLMTLGTLLGFLTFLGILGFPISMIAQNVSLISLASGAAQRIQEVLNGPDQRHRKAGNLSTKISGRIRFDGVNFSYNSQVCVLEDVSFDIQSGEHVAVFGLTGSGKSSLISLIPRFYEPNSGSILIDEVPIHEYDLDYLRSQMGLVLQESFLFSLSILDNIRYGRPNATIDQVIAAAKVARIHDTIQALPLGYDTVLGEYGSGLSGGQRQRVTIARAILKNPQILILDDCTSSLDSQTEREIQTELRSLLQGRTALIIAQKFSSLKLADRIIFLHEGTVQHMDSHDELLRKSPLYLSLYEAQAHHSQSRLDALEWRVPE